VERLDPHLGPAPPRPAVLRSAGVEQAGVQPAVGVPVAGRRRDKPEQAAAEAAAG